MADLPARDVERGKFAFSIYDFEGNDTMDAFYIGDCLRALNLNPTNAFIEKLGGTKKKGEKKLKVEEFLPIFSEAKKSKDYGTIEDFLECMKLYDKAENGTMLAAELNHILLSLGERLEDKEVDAFMKECCDPEDEEGNIPYQRNLTPGTCVTQSQFALHVAGSDELCFGYFNPLFLIPTPEITLHAAALLEKMIAGPYPEQQ